jgi:hypothetical protein
VQSRYERLLEHFRARTSTWRTIMALNWALPTHPKRPLIYSMGPVTFGAGSTQNGKGYALVGMWNWHFRRQHFRCTRTKVICFIRNHSALSTDLKDNNIWRDIKVVNDIACTLSQVTLRHQTFDLQKLSFPRGMETTASLLSHQTMLHRRWVLLTTLSQL